MLNGHLDRQAFLRKKKELAKTILKLKQNPIENRAISGVSGQKSVPE